MELEFSFSPAEVAAGVDELEGLTLGLRCQGIAETGFVLRGPTRTFVTRSGSLHAVCAAQMHLSWKGTSLVLEVPKLELSLATQHVSKTNEGLVAMLHMELCRLDAARSTHERAIVAAAREKLCSWNRMLSFDVGTLLTHLTGSHPDQWAALGILVDPRAARVRFHLGQDQWGASAIDRAIASGQRVGLEGAAARTTSTPSNNDDDLPAPRISMVRRKPGTPSGAGAGEYDEEIVPCLSKI